jgi:cell division protein FtsN
MPKLTSRDYKRSSRSSGAAKLKEFGLGVLVGAVLASAAFLIAGAHAHHRATATSRMGSGADPQSKAPHAPAPDDTSSDSPDPANPSGSASSPQSASASAGAQPQQYDFYRMLPRFKVPVSHDDEHPAHAGAPPGATGPEHAADSGPSYVLQIGSYRSTAEADGVRARLARAGIAAQVQRIVQGSSAWNRVRIGPLSDTELARVREQLRTANVHAMVIREDR